MSPGKGGRVMLAAREAAHFERGRAMEVAADILRQDLDIQAFFCTNDRMALGIAPAVGRMRVGTAAFSKHP
jgi:ABC-type sugar transport system substrate-binding protein